MSSENRYNVIDHNLNGRSYLLILLSVLYSNRQEILFFILFFLCVVFINTSPKGTSVDRILKLGNVLLISTIDTKWGSDLSEFFLIFFRTF